MMRRSIWGIAAIALCIVPDLHGQEVREVRPGDRVRVTLASRIAPAPLIGTVTVVGPDTLEVEREKGAVRRLSRAQVGRIEVSVRREFEGGKAALNGVLVMSPLIALAGIFFVLGPPDVTAAAGTLMLVAGLGGAFGGYLIGGTSPQDTWVEAHWPDLPAPFGHPDSLEADPQLFDSLEDR